MSFFPVTTLALIGFAIVMLVLMLRDTTPPKRLALHEIGTIIDRTIWVYRQHLLRLLILSAVFVPLGNVSSYGLFFLSTYLTLFVYNRSDWLLFDALVSPPPQIIHRLLRRRPPCLVLLLALVA